MAGPLLFGLLDALRLERPIRPVQSEPPPGLKRVEICPLSGAPRSPWCPHGKTGWIIAGVSPLKTCAVHREIRVDPATGLRLCRGDDQKGQARIAEFWDNDVLESFRLAGLRRETPPPFEKPCEDLAGSDLGLHPPRLVSPQPGLSFPVRPQEKSTIEFSAVSDRRRLFWFVDDAFVGEGNTVLWEGKPGLFVVRVVDDQGQSASTVLNAIPAE
jgi:penicillin-binding protein 1C